MTNLTGRLAVLSNEIIWAAEGYCQISPETLAEYNDIVSLGEISAMDYFDTKSEMAESECDVIDSLESNGEYAEAVRQVSMWRRQHMEDGEE